ncbi:L-threonylcarbamoyladenylate synthase [Chryseobacterium wanjuense]
MKTILIFVSLNYGKNIENLPENPQENLINEVIKTLNNGGLIIYPSDTVYALGCNIFDLKAMEKLAQIKKIKLDKAQFSIICNDLSHLSDFTRPIETSVFRFLKSHLPRPFYIYFRRQ